MHGIIVELSSRIHKRLGLAGRRTTISLHLQCDFKFQLGKSHLCIKNKTIKAPEQRTDLLAFSRTNTVDSHTVFKKKKMTYKGCSIEQRLDSLF